MVTIDDMKKAEYIQDIKKSLPLVFTDEKIKDLYKNNEFFRMWGVCYLDLRKYDLSNLSPEGVSLINFSSSTIFPSDDKMPKFFKPNEILNEVECENINKTKHDDSHVNMAVIDNPCTLSHNEFKTGNITLTDFSASDDSKHFHMEHILSNISSNKLGCSKNAKILAYTIKWEDRAGSTIKIFQDVLKRLDNGEKIQAVSISNQLYDRNYSEEKNRLIQTYVEALKNHKRCRCEVIDSKKCYENGWGWLFCPMLNNPEDINGYKIPVGYEWIKDCDIAVPTNKLLTEFGSDDGYSTNVTVSGFSFAIPIISYYYSVARKYNENLTFEEFSEICKKNVKVNENDLKVVNFEGSLEAVKQVYSTTKENV